jgi:hypothetical protein
MAIALFLLIVEFVTLERKNKWVANLNLFGDKKGGEL